MPFETLPLTVPSILAKMRDRALPSAEFRGFSDFVTQELVAELTTRTEGKIRIPVFILRAGLAFMDAFLTRCRGVPAGFVGIERQDVGPSPQPKIYYWKIPPIVAREDVVWVVADPMFATGGSKILTITKLIELGVPPERILGLCVFAAPEAVALLHRQPWGSRVMVWGAALDERLDARAYIVPGCGDYGDRYFGTDGESGLLDLD